MEGRPYQFLLKPEFRWNSWAAPKGRDGKIDLNRALTGGRPCATSLTKSSFPTCTGSKRRHGPGYAGVQDRGDLRRDQEQDPERLQLREIIDHIDWLHFGSQAEKHELSHLYEAKISNMGNAGRNGGEYYTPRPLIRAIIQVVKPTIGERIYDGAAGSAGFLCESFEY